MNCALVHLHLSSYLDGELPRGDALSIESHLTGCDHCRREYDTLLATAETLRGTHQSNEPAEKSRDSANEMAALERRRMRLRGER